MGIYRATNTISLDQLERLRTVRCEDGIVSLFLYGGEEGCREGIFLGKFRQALERFLRTTTHSSWRQAARRERGRIEDYLRWRLPVRGGLVLFSCQPVQLWEMFDIDVSSPLLLEVGPTVQTRPLTRLCDSIPADSHRTHGNLQRPRWRPMVGDVG